LHSILLHSSPNEIEKWRILNGECGILYKNFENIPAFPGFWSMIVDHVDEPDAIDQPKPISPTRHKSLIHRIDKKYPVTRKAWNQRFT
jgi:hypothetical protein